MSCWIPSASVSIRIGCRCASYRQLAPVHTCRTAVSFYSATASTTAAVLLLPGIGLDIPKFLLILPLILVKLILFSILIYAPDADLSPLKRCILFPSTILLQCNCCFAIKYFILIKLVVISHLTIITFVFFCIFLHAC
jgi:hypothetical protein